MAGTAALPAFHGDISRVEELLLRYLPNIRRFACKLLYRHNLWDVDPDEVVQAVALRVVRHKHTYDHSRGSFKNWVFIILINVIKNVSRHKRMLRRTMVTFDGAKRLGAGDCKSDLETDAIVEQREFYAIIFEALQRIPSCMREVFILREFYDMKHEDIARRLGVNCVTVRTRLLRARVHLAKDPRIQALR